MTFQDVLDGNIVVFTLSGKIMAFTECTPLREKVKEYIASDKINFVIDMADVPWMNSEGIGLLASAVATVGRVGGKIVLANINEKVKRVLYVTGCHTVIEHFDNRQAAIESFSRAPATD
jgi:anti-anti-sigma factor